MSHNTNSPPTHRMQLGDAWRAVRKLIADPEDTAQVFAVIRAMSGPALQRGFARFSKLAVGRRILDEQIDLVDTLRDRDQLRAMAPGSLGRAYLAFVERESLTADGLVAASETGETYVNEDVARYGQRLRDQHDLWHVLTDYGRDELGELCLLAFTYAQTRNRGIGLIVLVGIVKFVQAMGPKVIRAARRGYRAGRRTVWLPGADWEALLERPIDEVRAHLRIEQPLAYKALRQQLAAA